MPHPFAAAAAFSALPAANLEDRAARLPLGAMVLRRPLLRLVPGAEPCLAFLHLQPDMGAMGAALGGPAGDIARHLAEGVALRMLHALADPLGAMALAWGEDRAGVAAPHSPETTPPLLIDLPLRAIQAGMVSGAGPGSVASFAIDSAADPLAFAALAEAARRQGWAVALRGLAATSLAWLRPGAVAADWFILDWSEALCEAPSIAALRQLETDRLILTGCDTDAALAWGLGHDIRIFGGSALEGWAAGAGGRA